jgi:hypothetical protein
MRFRLTLLLALISLALPGHVFAAPYLTLVFRMRPHNIIVVRLETAGWFLVAQSQF